jgi:hypothetical protein
VTSDIISFYWAEEAFEAMYYDSWDWEQVYGHDEKHEQTAPEDRLWICPRAEDLPVAASGGWASASVPLDQHSLCDFCPCAVPHFEDECQHRDDRCPGCEPLDQFKAEENLSYRSKWKYGFFSDGWVHSAIDDWVIKK